jgi:NAD-dependent SIR2 family protein deacetylase
VSLPSGDALEALHAFLSEHRALVLSGAGISTDSGIPDYRGPDAAPRAPMRYQTFLRDDAARRRYWARSSVGWPVTARARPNAAHVAVARLERRGVVTGVLTQNVDGLHQQAGSRRVLELHGSLAAVICLDCGVRSARTVLQERMKRANPAFHAEADDVAPDGDVEIADALTRDFVVPACATCGGTLKPDVVFFGENVPKPRVDRAWRMLDDAEALLVLGSSLTVYSGYRFVRRAREQGKPVAIVNAGPTRGDGDAAVRSDGRLGEVLPALAGRWGERPPAPAGRQDATERSARPT